MMFPSLPGRPSAANANSTNSRRCTATIIVAVIFLALSVACRPSSTPPAKLPDAAPASSGDAFDEENSATVCGHVFWRGDLPQYPPFEAQGPGPDGKWRTTLVPNPYLPAINARTKSVEGAVVFLESVAANRCRPWDHPPVRVIAEQKGMDIEQGAGSPYTVGFVRLGDEIELDSHRTDFESISARGAAHFSFAFPKPNQPLRRKLNQSGSVEITSSAGHFWLRAYLFVVEHPYYGRTDADGRFTLMHVPAGEYRLVCWLPNPDVAERDRDPNLGQVIRHHHAPPLERFQAIEVKPRDIVEVAMQIGKQ